MAFKFFILFYNYVTYLHDFKVEYTKCGMHKVFQLFKNDSAKTNNVGIFTCISIPTWREVGGQKWQDSNYV